MSKATSIELDDALTDRVRVLAEGRQCSARSIMREAIGEYVEREEKRGTFRAETIAAREAFQATGQHATADEVDRRLASWGTETELPAPKCRT